jgi:hypothetical protein
MSLVTVKNAEPNAKAACSLLEQGDILFWDTIPFGLPADDIAWLRGVEQQNTRVHKNISYRPQSHVVRGAGGASKPEIERIAEIMREFSRAATEFLGGVLEPYRGKWSLDYASFRPIEEAGRDLPLHKRNELLHVDAFPSRPVHGGRILRFFININPTEQRVWSIGGRFGDLARDHAPSAGLAKIAAANGGRKFRSGLSRLGVPIPDRSAYDEFMLRFHDHMKEDSSYQETTEKQTIKFSPMTAWVVYTDGVPHSVLSGRLALEQTFIVPFDALVTPEVSPLRILENLAGRPLVTS